MRKTVDYHAALVLAAHSCRAAWRASLGVRRGVQATAAPGAWLGMFSNPNQTAAAPRSGAVTGSWHNQTA
jgi:hypothetical protein